MAKKKKKGRKKPPSRSRPGTESQMKVSTVEWSYDLIGKTIFSVSVAVGLVFIILYVITAFGPRGFDLFKYGNFHYLSAGIVTISGPIGIFEWYTYRLKLRQEEKFSDFLRDMAEYWKVGLSMAQAINTLARGEYGVLNKEIKKMSIQLSWGVAFNEVLKGLADTLNTRLVHRSVSLILEANKAGGKISDVLLTASHDTNEIRWIKIEREKGMQMYVWVIYISFFVYLAVILILVNQFLPSIMRASEEILGVGGGVSTGMAGLQIRMIREEFVVFIFYWSVIIQAVGNGLMAGTMGYGKVKAGLGHVFVMMLASWMVFTMAGVYGFAM